MSRAIIVLGAVVTIHCVRSSIKMSPLIFQGVVVCSHHSVDVLWSSPELALFPSSDSSFTPSIFYPEEVDYVLCSFVHSSEWTSSWHWWLETWCPSFSG